VSFWKLEGPTGAHGGWVSQEREIEGADADEVLDWASGEAKGRRFVVYARVVGGQQGEHGLIQLLGTGPLDGPSGGGPCEHRS